MVGYINYVCKYIMLKVGKKLQIHIISLYTPELVLAFPPHNILGHCVQSFFPT